MENQSGREHIPIGTNWIHKIEEALENSEILFVLISNNSINSNWLYFESGFAYSKGIKIIPIGILGYKISSSLNQPLDRLQGFNLTSHEGLNNIIAILNKELKCQFKEDFSQKDYEDLIRSINLDDYMEPQCKDDIEEIQFKIPLGEKFQEFDNFLKECVKQYTRENANYYLPGMHVHVQSSGHNRVELICHLGIECFTANFKIINNILLKFNSSLKSFNFFIHYQKETTSFGGGPHIPNHNDHNGFAFFILLILKKPPALQVVFYFLQKDIQYDSVHFKLTGKLENARIKMEKDNRNLYKYENLTLFLQGIVIDIY